MKDESEEEPGGSGSDSAFCLLPSSLTRDPGGTVMRWKAVGVLLVVLAGVGASLGFYWPFGRRPAELKLAGIVEIQEVRLGPRVAGRVKEVKVQEGDRVKPKQVLVTLEVPELEAQRDMLAAQVRVAEADLLKAENG